MVKLNSKPIEKVPLLKETKKVFKHYQKILNILENLYLDKILLIDILF